MSSSTKWPSLRALADRVGVFQRGTEKRKAPRRAVKGEFTALFGGPDGSTQTSPIALVNISETGLAFRCDWELAVGQKLLISDGKDVVEVIVQHKRLDKNDLVYGVEATLAAPLPAQFTRLVPESSLRLSKEMSLPDLDANPECQSERATTA